MKKRIVWIDFLSILAAICVVALHCNNCFWGYADTPEWKSSVFIETIAYWAVPIFFMVSGAKLIDYRDKYSTKDFFIKRFVKIVIPYIIFTTIFIVVNFIKTKTSPTFANIVDTFVNGKASVYWFFIPLFMVYLMIPVVSLIPKEKRKKVYSYIILISFIINSILPLLGSLIGFNLSLDMYSSSFSGYLAYALLGYLLMNEIVLTKKKQIVIYVLGILGFAARLIYILVYGKQKGQVGTLLNGYNQPTTFFYALSIFVFFRYVVSKWTDKITNVKVIKVISTISACGFGVYLIHGYFVYDIPGWFGFSGTSFVYRFLMPIPIFACCALIVYIIKKIPIIKHIL